MRSFQLAASYVPRYQRDILLRLPENVQKSIQELRLRANAPLSLSTPAGELWVTPAGEPTAFWRDDLLATNEDTVTAALEAMCEYSVHTHQNEMARGFVTTPEGFRVGLCGTMVVREGEVTSMRRINGLCIRIARCHHGCSKDCMAAILAGERIKSTLICGEPSSGKTSLLRDIANRLSTGADGRRFRVSVLDERGELARCGELTGCDLLSGGPKDKAIEQATRCLAPDVILFDEIGEQKESEALRRGMQTGVAVISTAHAADVPGFRKREMLMELLSMGCFDQVLFLKGRHEPGKVARILPAETVLRGTIP